MKPTAAVVAAREHARQANGRFGEYTLEEADVDLSTGHEEAVIDWVLPLGVDEAWFDRLERHQKRDLSATGRYTVLDSGGGPVEVSPGVTDEDADWVYTNGQCLALAAAMSEKTGWPIVVTEDDLGDTGPDGEPFYNIRHAYVQAPDGTLLDIRGDQGSVEDVMDADADYSFGDESRAPLTFYSPRAALENFDGWMSYQDVTAAEPFAAKVLATYKAGGYSWDRPFDYDALTPDDAKALLDHDIVRRYTQGDCGVLAHYLAESNGWGVTVVGEYETEEWDGDGAPAHVTHTVEALQHAYAVRPDGTLVDVAGVHHPATADTLARHTRKVRHDYPDAASADKIWNHEQWLDSEPWGDSYDDDLGGRADDVELARHVATLVTIAYGEAEAKPA